MDERTPLESRHATALRGARSRFQEGFSHLLFYVCCTT